MCNGTHPHNRLLYYAAILFVAAIMKYSVRFVDIEHLWFLLKPTNSLVGLLTASESVYIEDVGYLHERLNVIIDRSCIGFNLWVIAFIMFAFLAVKHHVGIIHRTLGIVLSLVAALFFTVFTNTSRIFASITFQPIVAKTLPLSKDIVHEAIGVTINLSFLILAYMIIDKLLTNKVESL